MVSHRCTGRSADEQQQVGRHHRQIPNVLYVSGEVAEYLGYSERGDVELERFGCQDWEPKHVVSRWGNRLSGYDQAVDAGLCRFKLVCATDLEWQSL